MTNNKLTNNQCGICADCVPQINGGSGFNNCAEAHAAQTAGDKLTDEQPEYWLAPDRLQDIAEGAPLVEGEAEGMAAKLLAKDAGLQEYRNAAPDVNYQHLSELYHAQEKRLFKLAQRIKGPAFDKYAHSPSQAIDVLESAVFGESESRALRDRLTEVERQVAGGNNSDPKIRVSPTIPDYTGMANDPNAGAMSLVPAARKPEAE